MSQSLRSLTQHLIDYAGLFPPARLPLDQAIQTFSRARGTSLGRAMLSRFICPAARLAELRDQAEMLLVDKVGPWQVSALGRSGDDAAGFAAGWQQDLAAVDAFDEGTPDGCRADIVEVRVPVVERVGDVIRDAQLALSGRPARVFFEVPWTAPESFVQVALDGIRAAAGHAPTGQAPGAKLRTGGVEAHMFPSCAVVARFIAACHERSLAFKATAGLHHPLRHHNETVDTHMHGFLNVFFAALAAGQGAQHDVLVNILTCEDAAAFRLGDDGITWHDLTLSTSEIEQGRQSFALSYGSCSFDEPVEDLRALGWL